MTEREKVIKGLEYCSTPGGCMDCVYYGKHCTINMYADAIKLLKEQEQAEQKHGHWIRSPGFRPDFQCSVCKETYVGDCRMFKYCPECGAIMDEEVMQE